MSITEATSTGQASSWHAPSKPPQSPMELAKAHQQAIRVSHERAGLDASCVRQLMAGRYVRSKLDDKLYLVTEVRLAAGWVVHLYGRAKGKRGRTPTRIGPLESVDIINVGGDR